MRGILRREDKANRNKEPLWVISLSITNKILLIDLVGLGSMNNTNTTPTDIFSSAIEKRAYAIILVHNHPSGGSLERLLQLYKCRSTGGIRDNNRELMRLIDE